jgi:hypothetical protein
MMYHTMYELRLIRVRWSYQGESYADAVKIYVLGDGIQ